MKLSLTLSTLLILFAGCTSTALPNCSSSPGYKNLGYVNVVNVLDSWDKEIISEGLSDGCERGDFLQLSNNEIYECNARIPSGNSNQVVLLRQDVEGFYEKGVAPHCGGSLATLCRHFFDSPKNNSILIEKGFVEPFILQKASMGISTYLLVTSNERSYSIQKEIDSSNYNYQHSSFPGYPGGQMGCFFKDSRGKEFGFSDLR
tara:strand:- start:88 stop:696 length:609 start_codon:yes stop_codon:yes gene_type:complete